MMNKIFGYVILFLMAIIVILCPWLYKTLEKNKALEREVNNVKTEYSNPQESQFRDSLHIASQSAQVYTVSEVKEKKSEVSKLVKDAVGTTRTLEDVHTVSTVIRDTVRIDSIGSWNYSDKWIDVSVKDSLLSYEVRDSLTTIVTTEYKHHFLWWRWGKKGYRVQIVSFNPHSHVKYNNYIKILK